jgi:hypothetical protein
LFNDLSHACPALQEEMVMSVVTAKIMPVSLANADLGNTKGGSIIVQLTSCLTGLESAV